MDDFSHLGMHNVPKNIDELEQHVGQVVPFHFDSGILALSFAVSLVGAACTLELFNRRTSRKGRYNQYGYIPFVPSSLHLHSLLYLSLPLLLSTNTV